MTRYIGPTRGNIKREPLHVCILSGTLGYREKSKGPKVLQKYEGDTILSHQTKTLLHNFPDCHICVTTGFLSDRVLRLKPHNVTIIENQFWETTNTIEEIRLYLNSVNAKRLLIIDGPVIFSNKVLQCTEISSIPYYYNEDKQEIGVSVDNQLVEHFSYGLQYKWGEMVYLEGTNLELLRDVSQKESRQLCLFETLNVLLTRGASIYGLSLPKKEIIKP